MVASLRYCGIDSEYALLDCDDGVPTSYARLLTDKNFTKAVCRNMRLFVSGSAPLLTEIFNTFKELAGKTILERYSMSETVTLVLSPHKGTRALTSRLVFLSRASRSA